MIIHNIQSDIEAIEKNSVLYEGTSFESRAQAIDYLEFNIIDRIDGLSQTINPPGDLSMLKQWAERIKYQLEYIDSNLFQQLRAEIGMGVYRGATLKSLFDEYVRGASINGEKQDVIGYDNLDVFINGLLLHRRAGIYFFLPGSRTSAF